MPSLSKDCEARTLSQRDNEMSGIPSTLSDIGTFFFAVVACVGLTISQKAMYQFQTNDLCSNQPEGIAAFNKPSFATLIICLGQTFSFVWLRLSTRCQGSIFTSLELWSYWRSSDKSLPLLDRPLDAEFTHADNCKAAQQTPQNYHHYLHSPHLKPPDRRALESPVSELADMYNLVMTDVAEEEDRKLLAGYVPPSSRPDVSTGALLILPEAMQDSLAADHVEQHNYNGGHVEHNGAKAPPGRAHAPRDTRHVASCGSSLLDCVASRCQVSTVLLVVLLGLFRVSALLLSCFALSLLPASAFQLLLLLGQVLLTGPPKHNGLAAGAGGSSCWLTALLARAGRCGLRVRVLLAIGCSAAAVLVFTCRVASFAVPAGCVLPVGLLALSAVLQQARSRLVKQGAVGWRLDAAQLGLLECVLGLLFLSALLPAAYFLPGKDCGRLEDSLQTVAVLLGSPRTWRTVLLLLLLCVGLLLCAATHRALLTHTQRYHCQVHSLSCLLVGAVSLALGAATDGRLGERWTASLHGLAIAAWLLLACALAVVRADWAGGLVEHSQSVDCVSRLACCVPGRCGAWAERAKQGHDQQENDENYTQGFSSYSSHPWMSEHPTPEESRLGAFFYIGDQEDSRLPQSSSCSHIEHFSSRPATTSDSHMLLTSETRTRDEPPQGS
eukprot:g56522.t1